MADDQEKNAGGYDEMGEVPETTGIHTITRGSVQKRLAKPESGVPFYDETHFPQELQIPERLKDNALAVEVHRQAKRILCGEEANISQQDFDYAKRFVEVLIAPSVTTPEDAARQQKFDSLTNPELTHQLEKQLAFSHPTSILKEQREILGITTPEEEKPFQIKVLEVEGGLRHEREKKWEETTKAPDMFVYEDPSGGFIIYVPADSAKILLDPAANESMRSEIARKLNHEYRHTQRGVVLGKDQGLFRLIDEPLADVIGYQYLTVFLNLLLRTTNTINSGDLLDAYESGDNKQMADCFAHIADVVSPKGLLLLGGKNSSNCSSEEDGIKDLPMAEGNFGGNEWLQLAETILAMRQERDPEWQAKLAKNLQHDYISLKKLEVSHTLLVMQYQGKGIQYSDVQTVNTFLVVLKTEIERRRALGEEGLYNKKKTAA